MHQQSRCFGDGPGKEFYAEYHDTEWGIPIHDERHLFEMLILEGAQAGLSWETVLKKRQAYRELFHHFDPNRVAEMTDQELECLIENPAIIRNRRKIFSTRHNARVFLEIQKEFGSFDHYLWQFINHKPIINSWEKWKDVPAETELSKKISTNLKKRGMSFVGPTIIYAFMQAVGMVSDHLATCPFGVGVKNSH